MTRSPFHGIFSSALSSLQAQPIDGQQMEEGQSAATAKKTVKPMSTSGSAARQTGVGQARPASGIGQVALDIFEYDNYYILKAPMAGVKLSDVDIEIADNAITIKGSRKQTDDIPENQYYLKECFWGEFSRTVTLPCSIDPKKVKATFNKECVLKILVPKEEKVKIIRISD